LLKIAKKFDIHCIVSGGNRLEDVSFKKVLLGTSAYENLEMTLIKDIFGILKESLTRFLSVLYIIDCKKKTYPLPVLICGS